MGPRRSCPAYSRRRRCSGPCRGSGFPEAFGIAVANRAAFGGDLKNVAENCVTRRLWWKGSQRRRSGAGANGGFQHAAVIRLVMRDDVLGAEPATSIFPGALAHLSAAIR